MNGSSRSIFKRKKRRQSSWSVSSSLCFPQIRLKAFHLQFAPAGHVRTIVANHDILLRFSYEQQNAPSNLGYEGKLG